MRFKANDKGGDANGNAVEGMYEIELAKRKRVEYRHPFDRGMNIIQRQKISDRNNMFGMLW